MIQGGGPVGLACAAWCLQQLPTLKLALIDRNPRTDEALENGDKRSDTRGIALSHGSKLLLETIHAWPTNCPEIHRIHVSQAGRFGRAIMTREELHQDALGHIARYRDIHLALRQALRKLQPSSPHFSWIHSNETPDLASQVESAESACVVHAEGGLFNQQEWIEAGRSYDQSALVGLVEVDQPQAHQAWERFTPEGPLALLPSHAGEHFLNLVWCSTPSTAQQRLELNEPDFLAALQRQFGSRLGHFISVRERRLYELGLNYRKEVAVDH
ncbi:MAG: ubiquinone biosynthesis protein UbiH, partial [Betaproteobacteria bacterium]|nr:ubiquinone biosynthesis protein UbiH [Betaproteobacteria bacterium]